VPDPRDAVPDLPSGIADFLGKAMAKDAAERLPTADAFIEALDAIDVGAASDEAMPSAAALGRELGAAKAGRPGAHLSRALGRAVRKTQREARPAPAAQEATEEGPPRKAWRLWLVIGLAFVVVTGGAAATAFMLAGGPDAEETAAGDGAAPPAAPDGDTTDGEGDAESDAEGTAPDAPPEPADEPAGPSDVIEENARIQLEQAKEFEKDRNAWPPQIINAYQAVIDYYPDTEAAEEARAALERLRQQESEMPEAGPAEGEADEGEEEAD
jgi:hypothetical protein